MGFGIGIVTIVVIADLIRNLLNERQILRFRRWRMSLRHDDKVEDKDKNRVGQH